MSAMCLILNFLSFLSWLSAVAGINLTVLKGDIAAVEPEVKRVACVHDT